MPVSRGSIGPDSLVGTGAGDTLDGLSGNDRLYGLAGDDWLFGRDGNDLLDGGVGLDRLYGGLGNDVYIVSDTTDYTYENAEEGTDTVQASVSHVLRPNIERLTLTGALNINGTGNDLANVISGNSGDNILSGRGGNDSLYGGAGSDRLLGGLGNDTFFISGTDDIAYENAGEGTDTVYSSVSYSLRANIERLVLTGTTDVRGYGNELANALTGNSGANVLSGGDGNDRLYGADGDDVLDGGTGRDFLNGGNGNDRLNGRTGADTLVGGAGDDLYYTDHVGDVVTEAAGGGTDTVASYLSTYTLGANVENGVIGLRTGATLNGNGLANRLEGNAGNDVFWTEGDDRLSDTIVGGAGDDTYNIRDNDVIIELAGGGIDSVTVYHSRGGYTLPAFVENATVMSTFNDELSGVGGNDLDNDLTLVAEGNLLGFGGNDILRSQGYSNSFLYGGDGDDTLIGTWDDTLEGGSGQDSFVLTNPALTITDFENGELIDIRHLDANSLQSGRQSFVWDNGTNSGEAGVLSIVDAGSGLYYLRASFDGGSYYALNLEVHVTGGAALTMADILI
ncbi:Ca2+-binding RTX toxin-like protein [Sphingomonas sp. F9_3S_D5_B_2]